MKIFKRLYVILFLGIGLSSFVFIEDPVVTLTATLNGASEVPANNSVASGTAYMTIDKIRKEFRIELTHNVVGAKVAYIHKEGTNRNGGIALIFTNDDSPFEYSSSLEDGQIADLIAGLYYISIHSMTYPDGEIQGRLTRK